MQENPVRQTCIPIARFFECSGIYAGFIGARRIGDKGGIMFYPDGSSADCAGYNDRTRFGKRVYPFTAWRFNHQPLYVILSGIEEKARP